MDILGIVSNIRQTCFYTIGLMRISMLQKSGLQKLYYGTERGLLAEMAILGKLEIENDATFYNREHASRSVNLETNMERAIWHNGSTNRFGAAEWINLSAHLFEIARRHKMIASSWDVRRRALGFALTPKAINRCMVELVDLAFPTLGRGLRQLKSNRLN